MGRGSCRVCHESLARVRGAERINRLGDTDEISGLAMLAMVAPVAAFGGQLRDRGIVLFWINFRGSCGPNQGPIKGCSNVGIRIKLSGMHCKAVCNVLGGEAVIGGYSIISATERDGGFSRASDSHTAVLRLQ